MWSVDMYMYIYIENETNSQGPYRRNKKRYKNLILETWSAHEIRIHCRVNTYIWNLHKNLGANYIFCLRIIKRITYKIYTQNHIKKSVKVVEHIVF